QARNRGLLEVAHATKLARGVAQHLAPAGEVRGRKHPRPPARQGGATRLKSPGRSITRSGMSEAPATRFSIRAWSSTSRTRRGSNARASVKASAETRTLERSAPAA